MGTAIMAIHDTHDEGIHHAACHAGDQAQCHADDAGNDHGHDTDRKGDAGTIDDAAQNITTIGVGAQPVLGRATLQNIVKIILVGIIGSNHRCEDGDKHHDEKQNCADHDDLAAEHDPEHAGGRDTIQQTLLFCLVFHSSFLLLAGAGIR